MKKTFFITGTDTGVGKTVLTARLARFLREEKICVAALKPICSGGRADARKIFDALDGALALDEINPWHFRAPLAPSLAAKRENQSVRLAEALAHVRKFQKKFDIVLVEGAGGLLSPLGKNFNSRDLISALRARPIIVAQNKLGAINHLLLTLEALPKKLRAKAKIVLMPPQKTDSATNSNLKLLTDFVSPEKIFILPFFGKNFETAKLKKHLRDLVFLRL